MMEGQDKDYEEARFREIEVGIEEGTKEEVKEEPKIEEEREIPTNEGEGLPTEDERMWGMLMWATTYVGFFTVIGFLIPIVMWVVKKDGSDYLDRMGKEIGNFLISYTVYGVVATASMIVLIGFLLVPILAVLFIIFLIVGTIKATESEVYRIPLIFRLL